MSNLRVCTHLHEEAILLVFFNAHFDQFAKVGVFHRGRDSLLVVDLLVYFDVRGVRSFLNQDVDLEVLRKGTFQLYSDAETDERRERAVRHRGNERYADEVVVLVETLHGNSLLADDVEVFQSFGLLRIFDGSY